MKAFEEIDGDGNGVIVREEVGALLRSLYQTQEIEDDEIELMAEKLGMDESGVISFAARLKRWLLGRTPPAAASQAVKT